VSEVLKDRGGALLLADGNRELQELLFPGGNQPAHYKEVGSRIRKRKRNAIVGLLSRFKLMKKSSFHLGREILVHYVVLQEENQVPGISTNNLRGLNWLLKEGRDYVICCERGRENGGAGPISARKSVPSSIG